MPPSPSREEALLRAASNLRPGAERETFLAQACGADGALRQRIERQLTEKEHAQTLVGGDAPDRDAASTTKRTSAQARTDPEAGQAIGRYKLLEKVGEGGCGVVYVAAQVEPVRRRVALKVIKLGMDTEAVVARFEAERQALAMMDHPNIAKVLDAGTTEAGRPFFVMELVRGIRITDYCDQASLPARDRLELFVKVCQAIQHAHQKGIIHRDIKPSNILVTLHDGVPVPKVIDFGIAKATEGRLTDATVYTQLHQFIGTPAYMSPEQAEMSGLDVDTRADIYSLGVLLYELLTGQTPLDSKELLAAGLDGMRRRIREQEPVRPSTRLATLQGAELATTAQRRAADAPRLIHLLKGDLDWIVMKCLEKDRTRRYESANSVADDVRRHLNHEPVLARPPSALYKLQKTWRRNKVLMTAGFLAAFSLTFGIVLSINQAIRATRAEAAKQTLLETEREARRAADAAQREAEIERDRARRNLYAADINLAMQALARSNLGKARRLLERTAPAPGQDDLRGWEWRHLWGLTRGDDLGEIARFAGGVFDLAIARDRDAVTVGLLGAYAEEKGVVLYDFARDRLIHQRSLGTNLVGVAGFVPGADVLVCNRLTSESQAGFSVLNAATLEEITRIPSASRIQALAISPDGKWVSAFENFGSVSVWWTKDWQRAWVRPALSSRSPHLGRVEFLGHGDRLAAGWRDGSVTVFHSETGSNLFHFQAHDQAITALASVPSANAIATGAGYLDSKIKIWNADTGALEQELTGHQAWIPDLAVAPDGALLASVSADQTVRLWDTKTWAPRGTLLGHEDEVYCAAFSRDGKRLFTGAKDGSVRLWEIPPPLRPPALRVLKETARALAIAPDGKHAVTLATESVLWDLEHGEKLATLTALQPHGAEFAFSPDGQQLLLGGPAGKVQIWDFARRASSEFDTGESNQVQSVRSPPGGKLFMTTHGTRNDHFKIWSHEDRALIREYRASGAPIIEAALSPGGDLATAHSDGTVTLWDVKTGLARTNFPVHRRLVVGIAFARDGRVLATAGEEGTAKLWDTTAGTEIVTLKGHLKSVHALAIAPDGSRLATGGGGQEAVKLWDLRTHQELITLTGEGSMILWLGFSPDGSKLLGLNERGHIHIWRAPSWEEISAERQRAAKSR